MGTRSIRRLALAAAFGMVPLFAFPPAASAADRSQVRSEALSPKFDHAARSVVPHALPAAPLAPSAAPTCQPNFSVEPTPTAAGDSELTATAAVSGTDIWAVGDHKLASGIFQTLAEHWNGSSWSMVPTPNVGGGDNFLLSVAAIGTADMWAVGISQVNNTSLRSTLTEHWDGTAWTVVASPNVATKSNSLFGVRAIATNNVIAVGRAESSNTIGQTLAEQWNGTSWTVMTTANGAESFNELSALTVISATNVWAVGDRTSAASLKATCRTASARKRARVGK